MMSYTVDDELLTEIYDLLYFLGLRATRTHFFHTSFAIYLAVQDPDRLLLVTKWLYPDVAKHYATNWNAVERNIRTAVTVVWRENREGLLAEDLNRSLERFPNDIDILSFSGFVASERGDMKEAIAIFRQALKNATIDEDRSMLWGYIGDMYHEQGLSNKCFKAYDKALRFNPNNILVLNNYAYFLCLANKDLNRALLMAKQVVEEQSGNYTYLDTYAWVLHCLGRDREAKSIMQQALSLSSQRDPDLLAHYGDILWSLGERYVAESYWDKAVKQGYDTVKMEEHRKRLKEESEDAVMK